MRSLSIGQIYRGSGHGAIEIGHLRVPESTITEIVLARARASGFGVGNRVGRPRPRAAKNQEGQNGWLRGPDAPADPELITAADVAEAALAGERDASAILDRARRAVAFALTQAITLLAPRRIVMGGGVSLIGETLWFEPIRRLIDRDVFAPFRGRFDIVPAALGEEVVVHGALALAND